MSPWRVVAATTGTAGRCIAIGSPPAGGVARGVPRAQYAMATIVATATIHGHRRRGGRGRRRGSGDSVWMGLGWIIGSVPGGAGRRSAGRRACRRRT